MTALPLSAAVIDKICRHFPNLSGIPFLGIFPADEIPSLDQIDDMAAIVVNTHSSGWPGEHWLLMVFSKVRRYLEFFDSFGRHPDEFNPHIADFVSTFPEVEWKSPRFQSPETSVCGYYCIFYLTKLFLKYNRYEIFKELSSQQNADQYVVDYFVEFRKNSQSGSRFSPREEVYFA
ncbi:uncharacterized protein CDAR_484351 [Caerostris darwini]|uniref:Ubiquitin-like protease family profile domain-containing protein n=1 Tax=Caerostris darwini TaxID=1538125 RepID=A0AAV4MUV9_9ARAC|nr:uncharacterized protein CDAR_484351 [Caerostris darwini]